MSVFSTFNINFITFEKASQFRKKRLYTQKGNTILTRQKLIRLNTSYQSRKVFGWSVPWHQESD